MPTKICSHFFAKHSPVCFANTSTSSMLLIALFPLTIYYINNPFVDRYEVRGLAFHDLFPAPTKIHMQCISLFSVFYHPIKIVFTSKAPILLTLLFEQRGEVKTVQLAGANIFLSQTKSTSCQNSTRQVPPPIRLLACNQT